MEYVFQMTKDEFRTLLKESVLEVLSEVHKENPDQLMNIQEAAAFLGLAVNTLYEKTSERLIPHYKQGKKVIFKKSELIGWIESGRIKTLNDIEAEAIRRSNSSRRRL